MIRLRRSYRSEVGLLLAAFLCVSCGGEPAAEPPHRPGDIGQERPFDLDYALAQLSNPHASLRIKGAQELAAYCVENPDADFDRVYAVFQARISSRGDDHETDRRVHTAMWEAQQVVGLAKAKVRGVMIARPVDLETMDDQKLWRLAVSGLRDVGFVYGDRATLDEGLALMSEGQRALWATDLTMSEINNGGFYQYFYNSTGMAWAEARDGFRLVGAEPYASVLADAGARLPGRKPSPDRGERITQADAVGEAGFADLDKQFFSVQVELDALMAAYVRAHPDSFFE